MVSVGQPQACARVLSPSPTPPARPLRLSRGRAPCGPQHVPQNRLWARGEDREGSAGRAAPRHVPRGKARWWWWWSCESLSRVRLLVTPGTAAHRAPLSMGFSRRGYWSRLLCPLLLSRAGEAPGAGGGRAGSGRQRKAMWPVWPESGLGAGVGRGSGAGGHSERHTASF